VEVIKFLVLAFAFSLSSCNEPQKQYQCEPGENRRCLCKSGLSGAQQCSKGPVFTNWPPREWIPCSCCWTVYENDLGPYYIEKNDASGCWDDIYDPATPTYDVGDELSADRRSSDSGEHSSWNNSKDN
tara:strand:+ start:847 stop:1230 length:384 start_codon:yes stop_codon:yes gene_type:complete